MIEDLTARRRAAIEAKRLRLEELSAEWDRDHEISRIEQQKYEQAMAAKRAREGTEGGAL
jgi:hypothetical protein